MDIDVLVIGAGLVDLIMATELRRHGGGCHLINKLTKPSPFCMAIDIRPGADDRAEIMQGSQLPLNWALATLMVSPKRQHMGLDVCLQPAQCSAIHVAAFLRELLRHVLGHATLLCDQRLIHQGPAGATVRAAQSLVRGRRRGGCAWSRRLPPGSCPAG